MNFFLTNISNHEIFPNYGMCIICAMLYTVQLNSNLMLAHVCLAKTWLIFKYTHGLAASAQLSLW